MQMRPVWIQQEQQDEVTKGQRIEQRQGKAGYDKHRTTGTRQLQDLQQCSWKLSAPPSPSLLNPLAPVFPHEPVMTPHTFTQPATSSMTCSLMMAIPSALPHSGTQTMAQERACPKACHRPPWMCHNPLACLEPLQWGGYVKLFSLVCFFLIFTLLTTYGTSHREPEQHRN
jgi:hypothetical protein